MPALPTREGRTDDVADAFVVLAEASSEDHLERALLGPCARAVDALRAGLAVVTPGTVEVERSQQVTHAESFIDPPTLSSLQTVASSGQIVDLTVRNEVLICLPIESGELRLGAAWFVVPAAKFGQVERGALVRLVRAFAARLQQLRTLAGERTAAEETAVRLQFVEQLVGALGHDLRGPLQVIGSSAQLLTMSATPESIARSAERIFRNVKRSAQMVEDLLDFVRIGRGTGLAARRGPVDVCELAEEIVGDFRVNHPKARIELSPCANAIGQFDGSRLAQVFTNLLTNAVRYGAPDRPIRLAVEATDHEVVFTVHNEGPPIPQHLMGVLFDPFRRAQGGTPGREQTGLGLGLFIVRHVVLAHGGAIDVSSSAQEGTTFTVVLPKTQPADREPTRPD